MIEVLAGLASAWVVLRLHSTLRRWDAEDTDLTRMEWQDRDSEVLR